MKQRVLIEIEDHVAHVTLNRPDKHNALDRAMFEALTAAGRSLMDEPSVRAVVLDGAGENFCAGIDVSVFNTGTPLFSEDDMRPGSDSGANFFQETALVWRRLPVPVIAVVHGVAFGAGLQVALGADFRLATPDSRWAVMEIRWGIIPDMGISITSAGVLTRDRLKWLAMTGAVIDGAKAERYGLVTETHDSPLDAAMALAGELSSRSPAAVCAIKSLIDAVPDEDGATLLRREARLQSTLIGSANQREAVAANLARRPPNFADPDR